MRAECVIQERILNLLRSSCCCIILIRVAGTKIVSARLSVARQNAEFGFGFGGGLMSPHSSRELSESQEVQYGSRAKH